MSKNTIIWISLLAVVLVALGLFIWCAGMIGKIIGALCCILILLVIFLVWYLQYTEAKEEEERNDRAYS